MNAVGLQGETIIILANAEWDWSTRINCHHIAARLATHNHVLFVDTVGGRTPAPRELRKIARRLRRITGGVRKINDGLTVLSPFVLPIYGSERIRELNTALLTWQIRRALPKRPARPILYFFLPSLVGLVSRFDASLIIYHCIDYHAANPNVPSRQVNEWETRLMRIADVVFASAATLYEDKRAFNPNTFYLPNVADTGLFVQARDVSLPIPDDVKDLPRPMAGYIGNISAYKIDVDLLCVAVQKMKNMTFVLIGPIGRGDPSTDISKLRSLNNIFLLGERPYVELPRYVKAFDVCLIPFNLNESNRGSLPMKFFEYLTAGKPIVATDLPALAEFRDFFYPVHNAVEFVAALDAALHEGPARSAARVELARKYSWDTRIVEIEKIMSDALARRQGMAR